MEPTPRGPTLRASVGRLRAPWLPPSLSLPGARDGDWPSVSPSPAQLSRGSDPVCELHAADAWRPAARDVTSVAGMGPFHASKHEGVLDAQRIDCRQI